MYYGTTPPVKSRDEASDTFLGLEPTPTRVFLIPFLLGITTFLVTLIVFNTLLYTHRNVVIWLIVLGVVLCMALINIESFGPNTSPSPSADNRSVWAKPLGVCCICALVLGSVLGLFCYDVYGYFSFIYRNSRTYQNTVPSQSAASVADAGRMTFASEAYVDQASAVGYSARNGVTYCVAPIRDQIPAAPEAAAAPADGAAAAPADGAAAAPDGGADAAAAAPAQDPNAVAHVEFWAVGYDCCGWSGDFKCDAAGDPEARGGIVVFDNEGIFFDSNRDYYEKAVRKAEAAFNLKSAKKPIYVRWVADNNLNMLQNFYLYRCIMFISFMTIFFAVASASFAFAYTREHYKKFFGLEDFDA